MQGDPRIIEILNEVLTGELTAINQYFLHARICKNWGYERIANTIHKESIDEMKHAQNLTDRVLFLDGIPNLQKLGKLNIGETVPEQLKSDMALEFQAIERLRTGINLCMDLRDYASKDLLEQILVDEERHVDWLEAQLKQIADIGVENYLAQQIAE